jgi:hypothetical protein
LPPAAARSAADNVSDLVSDPCPPAVGHSLAVAVLAALSAKLAGGERRNDRRARRSSVSAARGALLSHEKAHTETGSRTVGPAPRYPEDHCWQYRQRLGSRYRAEAAGNVLADNQAADEVANLDAGDLTVTRAPRGPHSSSPPWRSAPLSTAIPRTFTGSTGRCPWRRSMKCSIR